MGHVIIKLTDSARVLEKPLFFEVSALRPSYIQHRLRVRLRPVIRVHQGTSLTFQVRKDTTLKQAKGDISGTLLKLQVKLRIQHLTQFEGQGADCHLG